MEEIEELLKEYNFLKEEEEKKELALRLEEEERKRKVHRKSARGKLEKIDAIEGKKTMLSLVNLFIQYKFSYKHLGHVLTFSTQSIFTILEIKEMLNEDKKTFVEKMKGKISRVRLEEIEYGDFYNKEVNAVLEKERLEHLFTEKKPDIISTEEQKNMLEQYKQISFKMLFLYQNGFDEEVYKEAIERAFFIWNSKYANSRRDSFIILNEEANDDETKKFYYSMYQKTNATFIHQLNNMDFDRLYKCGYLLNKEQIKEMQEYFFPKFQQTLEKIKSKKRGRYSEKNHRKLQFLKERINQLLNWEEIKH